MSPKIGKIELRVLALLREARERGIVALTTTAIAEALYGPEPTHAQQQGLRRALRTLEAKRRIETERLPASSHKAVRLAHDPGGTPTERSQP